MMEGSCDRITVVKGGFAPEEIREILEGGDGSELDYMPDDSQWPMLRVIESTRLLDGRIKGVITNDRKRRMLEFYDLMGYQEVYYY
jgi:hypothetical protein